MSDESQQHGNGDERPVPEAGASAAESAGEPGATAAGAQAAPVTGARAKKPAKAKKRRPRRTGWRRLVPTWRMLLGTFVALLLLLGGAFLAGYLIVDIPPANAAATKQSNVYLYADGSQLARDGKVNRENVQLSQVPKRVQHAVLAAEDREFYSESAVDPQAMLRAAWNTATGKGRQSGSTITQQYVKNYYLDQDQTLSRKVKEFFISIKLDRQVSKDDILAGYLNTSYFGRNAYGIQAAAQSYFGKDVGDISVAQGAYLATLLNSPNAYDVAAHPENKPRAQGRWNYVMDGMVDKEWLSPKARAAVKFPKPKEAKGAAGLSGQRGYLVKAVEDYLSEQEILDADTLARGGYRITTTLDPDRQDAFVDAVDEQLMSKVDREARKIDRNVRAGGASIDTASGKVVAMYGGIDYTQQYVNNATRRDYQVGSTFKPFVFTAAAENDSTTQDGRPITPSTVYDGTDRRPVQGWDGGTYAPANEDDVDYGSIPVRTATDRSVNSVYAQMAVDVGSDKVRETAVDLGIPKTTPDLNASPSIALGPSTASVLDMAEAYATLANHGKHGRYTLIERITKDGKEIDLPDTASRQAVSREAADTTTSMLRSVVDGGTGTEALAAGRPAAGKTGTAEEDKAAWFAGYTPDLATVVAVMGQDPDTAVQTPLYGALGEARINGGGFPARIWAQFTREALEGRPVRDFDLRTQDGADEPLPPVAPDEETAPEPDESSQQPSDGPSTGPSEDPTGTPATPGPETPDEGGTEGQDEEGPGGTDADAPDGDTDDGGTLGGPTGQGILGRPDRRGPG
ncbi:Penicillin-binding protein 1A [Streptomyces sp. YIM 130001]|uniref:transglycosylase domain-containing protein n=1 Tax=Streptomyces sp. YIM 130001 TaxID=2259644 RepID=UPI000E651846|nr:transglycosylase domain-containing protein [Streptomyces sp. YIM 130001]RII19745.1 Penicillin-binding protein 1A [Streptomyces sp. YIM 130001]